VTEAHGRENQSIVVTLVGSRAVPTRSRTRDYCRSDAVRVALSRCTRFGLSWFKQCKIYKNVDAIFDRDMGTPDLTSFEQLPSTAKRCMNVNDFCCILSSIIDPTCPEPEKKIIFQNVEHVSLWGPVPPVALIWRKIWGEGQSGQAIKLFRCLDIIVLLLFLTSFILDDVKIAELSNNSFE